MTQEQKYLVLKDLCARLPYGVAVKFKVNEVAAIEEKFTYVVNGEYHISHWILLKRFLIITLMRLSHISSLCQA